MDFFGKQGEKAAEAVQNLSQRLEDLESHVNAVDNAVQDLRQESRETDIQVAQENKERLEDLEQLMMKLTEVQKKNLRDIESERSREIQLEDQVEALNQRLKRTREEQKEIKDNLEKLEGEIKELEDTLGTDTEINKSKIESRVPESRFERKINGLERQISQLKTSVNSIADELDEENIEVE